MTEDQRIRDRESRLRSLLKAITYRIAGTVTTTVLVFFVTGQLELALAVGVVEPLFKIVVYYLHERLWALVPRGTFRRFVAGRTQP